MKALQILVLVCIIALALAVVAGYLTSEPIVGLVVGVILAVCILVAARAIGRSADSVAREMFHKE